MSSASARTTTWSGFLQVARGALGDARFSVFETLMCGWVLAPGRRTITAMICAGDPEGRRTHDAYHRFVRCGRWPLEGLSRVLVVFMVKTLTPEGPVRLAVDDTLFKETGRSIEGTGVFRDAVASTKNKVVYALGLNLVVVTLVLDPAWGG